MSELSEYKVNHLLLLVGSNPVPNAVAGTLLASRRGRITLIHSAEGHPDDPRPSDGPSLVQRLIDWFRPDDSDSAISYPGLSSREVKEADADSVRTCVRKLLDDYERDVLEEYTHKFGNLDNAPKVRLGLNYTGGTKVMSVHAYRALESWINEHDKRHRIVSRDPVFSYLDARTLQMCIDPSGGKGTRSFYVGRDVKMSILDLLKLHNWKLIKWPDGEPVWPKTTPVLPDSAAELLTVHSNPSQARIWTEWLRTKLFPKARKRVSIPSPFWVYQSGKELQGQYDVKQAGREWKSSAQLQNQEIPWPDLPPLRKTMSNELEQHGAQRLNLTAAARRGCNDEKDFCKWLSGTWLESAVLAVLKQCAQQLHLNDYCMDIKLEVPGSSDFQFDVVAMRGYQLFAFSCSTDSSKALLKQKLFEAYLRARQMGGDEACTALVCCAEQEQVKELEAEMRRDMIVEGRIRVFGREDLADLATHIGYWVREQSRDPDQQKPTCGQRKEE